MSKQQQQYQQCHQYHQYKFMYCKHAYTFVLICGKGNRLKIHKWYNKHKVTVTVYKDNRRIKTYVLSQEKAKCFWNFVKQLHENFIYSKQYFKRIDNKDIMVNLYNQLFEDILNMVKQYANENS